VVGFYGTGMITYQQALAAVFIEGWIFIAISLTGE
jgi:AGZA family xanthine/uracil permease-like MFS transporter